MLVSFAIYNILQISTEYGCRHELVDLYNDKTWYECKQSLKMLDHKKISAKALGIELIDTLNLPSVDLAREVDYVGIYTGAKVDKFEKCHLTKLRSDKVSAPIISECPIALECRVCEVVPMGSHDVFVADILGISCDERLFDSEGKLHFEEANLMAYAHGQYYALGEIIGRFGFSTDKQKKVEKPRKSSPVTEKGEKGKKAEKKPFYESAPRAKSAKKKPTDKNKGAPHGKRGTVKK